jgi:TrmH family RNA methyltransferase
MISKTRLKYLTSLKQKKYRERERRFLIEGLHLCEEILESDFEVETLLYCPSRVSGQKGRQLIRKFENAGTPVEEINSNSLRILSGTVHSQGIICLVRKREYSFAELVNGLPELLLALDKIKDPGNLGTIIRTADWFGVGGILLSQDSVELTNPKVLRATMGSAFHVPILENQDLNLLLPQLKEMQYSLLAADIFGTVSYPDLNASQKHVLILGNEIAGVSKELKNLACKTVRIPKIGKGNSLNVAVAAGIILAELSKRRLSR